MSTGPRTPEGKARSQAAKIAGLERWREEMRAKIAAGVATRFPTGRKPGARWLTKRMWDRKMLAEHQELCDENARRCPALPPRRRGRPTIIESIQYDAARLERLLQPKPPSAVFERLTELIREAKARDPDLCGPPHDRQP
jgi:hypothetical protein